MKRGIFFWVLAVFFIVGCAAAPPAIEKKDVAAPAVKPAEETPAAPPRMFDDRDLLLEGLHSSTFRNDRIRRRPVRFSFP